MDALIPGALEEPVVSEGVAEVDVTSISPNPRQPRSEVRDEDLAELAASIKERTRSFHFDTESGPISSSK